MISLIQYDEFGKNMDLPSIKDSFNKGKYDGQSKIIDYLKKGKVTAVSMGKVFDVFTGKEIMHENKLMNDGECSVLQIVHNMHTVHIIVIDFYN